MSSPFRHAPGIYFGLDEDVYHADPALGSTDLKRLLTSPPDYWWNSWMNPAKPEESDKAHLVFGRAVHKMVLEGEAAFSAAYRRAPDPATCLVTDDDCVRWISENGAKIAEARDRIAMARRATETDEQVGEIDAELKAVEALAAGKLPRSKAGKVTSILLVDPTVAILDEIKAQAEAERVTLLPAESYDRIVTAAAMIQRNPNLATAFEGGRSEVSIFWEQDLGNGGPVIPCKCRIDYLKLRGVGDLKSISNTQGRPLPQAARGAIATYRYDVQAAHYMTGREQIAALLKAGAVFGEHDPKWLARVAAQKTFGFVFVFFQSQGAPITWATSISPGSPVLDAGRSAALVAMENYQRFMRDFGTDAAWVLVDPVEELDIGEMPAWYGRVA